MLDATPSRTTIVSYGHHWFTGIKNYPRNSSFAQDDKNGRNAFKDCHRELWPPLVYWDKEVPPKLIKTVARLIKTVATSGLLEEDMQE
ncbi:hypothetical protein Pyn_00943 [Prunus yedoensis var. nudiflora]|uniref:Uncharacterized protein n=1 Tax=Prunus yedoensis var. nudiflora TaxID=2094558 RepID=A0A314UGV1_PRUYE|nr:hypothetical protein Pyn_00943 [Prunus yedoensis var. nudiflora]